MKLIICPNDTKMKLLEEEKNNTSLSNNKYLSKTEYLNSYYGEYNVDAIYYLMNKYKYHIDIAKVYLKNLMYIEDKPYKSKKLLFLKDLKKEMEPFLITHPTFKNYLKSKEIEVNNIYDLEPIDQKNLSYEINIPKVDLSNIVYEFPSLEKEVSFVCLEIRKLLEKDIPLNKIYLVNVSEDYYYTLDKMFSYYGIPIMIPYKNSIYGTKIVKDYLEENILLDQDDEITNKLKDVLGELSVLDEDSVKRDILISRLKNTYLKNTRLEEAVTIKDLKNSTFNDDEYVFLLGFNQDSMPSVIKDIDYLNDYEKEELGLYTTTERNKLERKLIPYLISSIKNITITYKLSSPFEKYYPSSFIKDYNLEVIRDIDENYHYSSEYNKIRLGEYLDNFDIYGEKSEDLILLNSNYDIKYKSYSNKFTGINKDKYLENLPVPLRLSYTSLNNYNECRFKYYINNVLKLGIYEDTFQAYIGSLYHYILENYNKPNFDFNEYWDKYLEKRELSLKEVTLLSRIKKDAEEFIQVLLKQNTYTEFKNELHEKELTIPVRTDIAVEFTGKIDKIMSYQNLNDTYYSIVDYKSGKIDTHIEPMKYGLHMQLPIYLYLLNYSKLFDNPMFTGIYYQNILFNKETWSLKLEEDDHKKYYLKGYSTNNLDLLSKFDKNYKDSNFIYNMSYTEEKGFNSYAKIIDSDTMYLLMEYTKKLIDQKTDEILEAKFGIDPKVLDKKNISCQYCNFEDICFKTNDDEKRLEKVNDLSFLGGDIK